MCVSVVVRGGHQEDLTLQMDLGDWRLLTHSHSLRMCILPTVSIAGTDFKDAGLKGQCVAKTIWMVYETEPS